MGEREEDPVEIDEATTEVLVVGGGLAGLAAATTAARSGRRVLLLEARSEPGGRARTTEQDGFLLNEGPHALYAGGEALPVLRELGVEPKGTTPPTKGAMGLADGRLGLLPVGAASLARTDLVSFRAKVALGRQLAALPKLDPATVVRVPLADWLADVLPDRRSRDLVAGLARVATYSNDPDHFDAGAAVVQLQRALDESVLYLDGGWATLVRGLTEAAVAAGVRLVTSEKVAKVEPGPAGVVVRTTTGELTADAVVVTPGGPAGAADLLGVADGPLRDRADSARPSLVAVLDVGLRRPWGSAPTFVMGIDAPLYLSVHAPTADLAPEGGSLVSVARYLPPDSGRSAAEDRRELEALLDLVQPRWRSEATTVRFLHRVMASTDIPTAATGGLAGRPSSAVPGRPGVHVAGDWVGPQGLLADAALASGAAAGRAAAGVQEVAVAS
jgi:phytoene dehydrogenase-like protein